ncbi:MAG: hypothetical protein IT458_04075 [Planctomycetes bacterium]|nr:hypothetical protein [Planctomycetota bacterium]
MNPILLFALLASALPLPDGPKSPTPASRTSAAPERPIWKLEPFAGQDRQGRPPQDRDYAPSTLWNEYHGEYMVKYRPFTPDITGSYIWDQQQQVQGEAGDFDLQQVNFLARLPFALQPDTMLRIGGRYQLRDYNFDNLVVGAEDDELHVAGLNVGLAHFVNDRILLEGEFMPGIYSDFDGALSTEDYQWYAKALLSWRLEENGNLFLKFGVNYDGTFEEMPVYPVLGLSWYLSPEFRFDVLAPEYLRFSWTPSNWLILGVGADVQGDEFRQRSAPATGKIEYSVNVQEIRAYGDATIRFTDNLSAFGRLGAIVAGDYQFRDPAGARYNGTLEPNFFFEVGFGVKF